MSAGSIISVPSLDSSCAGPVQGLPEEMNRKEVKGMDKKRGHRNGQKVDNN